ncbi:MAG: hypothetical protein E6I76_00710 [Chloroflexi bacterium]|nr:MAG: hypothetical protein E6I76_00710 [Chloroflexota bacterium]
MGTSIRWDEHLIEVHVTAIEGRVSPDARRRLIELNLALLEPIVEALQGHLSTHDGARREVVGRAATATR